MRFSRGRYSFNYNLAANGLSEWYQCGFAPSDKALYRLDLLKPVSLDILFIPIAVAIWPTHIF